ncbi:hypothetical protein F2P81_010709 [Scophthalmus maximus]|uniref:Uncharacterized protein n=1 Tax=Scophthalmus maximus TaxID=52904 RepID=A0A6A4SYH3_SCOMX|nr:hypothetical protein F2P81_010709 [Scophthalmus maximus]
MVTLSGSDRRKNRTRMMKTVEELLDKGIGFVLWIFSLFPGHYHFFLKISYKLGLLTDMMSPLILRVSPDKEACGGIEGRDHCTDRGLPKRKKTNHCFTEYPYQHFDVPVVIHGEQVDVVDQYKYHGTLFDNTSSVCWFPSLIVKNRNNVHTGVPLHLNHWSAPS